jgi:hypothetical protein
VADVAFSKEALDVLGRIKRTLEDGKQAQVVQTTPHLVLLSRPFYDEKLKPLLSRWALIWLLAHGCNGDCRCRVISKAASSKMRCRPSPPPSQPCLCHSCYLFIDYF